MTWLLRPGLGLARRDAGQVQVGLDRPRVAVLPDSHAVRLLLLELAQGGPLTTLDDATAPALDALVGSGLVVAGDDEAARTARRGACRVHLDVPDSVLDAALDLVAEAGLAVATEPAGATVALVWSVGEPARERADRWMRADTPHLVVIERPDGPVLGPYVVPGETACLRCVDAHAGEADPRRSLVVEQLADSQPLRPASPDPARRSLALGWAVHDLVTAAEGGVPGTWSATVSLETLPPEVTAFRRHPHCGCSWAEDVG